MLHCYGDAEPPNVVALRRFRDEKLRHFLFGRAFIKVYEFFSPPLAARLGKHQNIGSSMRRRLLEPLVKQLDGSKRMKVYAK